MGQLIQVHLSLAQSLPELVPSLDETPEQTAERIEKNRVNREASKVAYQKALAEGIPVMNGRGVRFRKMDSDEVAELEDNGARAAGEGASSIKFQNTILRFLLRAMVKAVTEPGLFELEGAKWEPVSAKEMATKWNEYFGAKETDFLERMYRSYHELNVVEVGMLQGKVRSLVTEG